MLRITIEITKNIFFNIITILKNNLINIVWILTILLPYLMYYLGQYVYEDRGRFAIGGEALIPLLVYLLLYYIKEFANKIGKGTTIPTPTKRFTEEHDDGEITIENSRIQELILYLNDLENWMERKGYLNK